MGLLERMTGSPIVSLNRAIAVAMVHGPAEGLHLLEPLEERVPGHRLDAALVHYRADAARTTSAAERDYLTTRAARLRASQA